MARRRFATFRRRGGDPVPAEYGVDRWRPYPTAAGDWNQIGVGAPWLSQFPARWDQPQLHQGVEGLRSGYLTPSRSVVPTFQQTQQGANRPGPQRAGQTYTGPVGPISANQLMSRVTAAQVRQSGLQALSWASQLSEG